MWFVKNELYTTSIKQTTKQDSVQKSSLWGILFDKFCLRRILFYKNIWPVAHFLPVMSSA